MILGEKGILPQHYMIKNTVYIQEDDPMGLNDTPSAERIHIGFFGCRNAGKSSVVNAITGQDLAVVSDTAGTTTDPVMKAMEILPLGPVMIIDTPGFDDVGELGELRIQRTRRILNRTDIALLVVDTTVGMRKTDRQLVALFEEKQIPYLILHNKSDLLPKLPVAEDGEMYISAATKAGIHECRERIGKMVPGKETKGRIAGDLIRPSDFVVLVVPIDSAAPKGRLILPQQQTIRDLLEADGVVLAVKETGLRQTLEQMGKRPALVITDSQVFASVAEDVPEEIPLTSFSILMARYKGYLETAVKGVAAVESLTDGDKVLISEGCTHHRQCDDIGSVKIPRWLRTYTGKELIVEFSAGREFPEDLSSYSLVIHCGGCMLNEREVRYRMKCAVDQNIPFTNYGITIAYMQGILKRSVGIFPDIASII